MAARYTKIEFYIAENLPSGDDNIPMYYTPPIRGTSFPLSPSTETNLLLSNNLLMTSSTWLLTLL